MVVPIWQKGVGECSKQGNGTGVIFVLVINEPIKLFPLFFFSFEINLGKQVTFTFLTVASFCFAWVGSYVTPTMSSQEPMGTRSLLFLCNVFSIS